MSLKRSEWLDLLELAITMSLIVAVILFLQHLP